MYDNPIWNEKIIERTLKLEEEVSSNTLRYIKWYCSNCGTVFKQKSKVITRCEWCGSKLEKY